MNPCKVSLHKRSYLSLAARFPFFRTDILQCFLGFVYCGDLYQRFVGNGFSGQLFGIPLQCFQRVCVISPGMGPAERAADILIVLIQRLVPTECVGYQCSGKPRQELLDVALAPGLSYWYRITGFPSDTQLYGNTNI